jgi:predicted DNA-binding transcriptional regulator
MKTKTKIITSFLDLPKGMTIKEIARSIQADYRITHDAVQRLLDEEVLSKEKIGGSWLCTFHHKYTPEVHQAEEERRQKVLQNPNLQRLYHEILNSIGTVHFTCLLYSSTSMMHVVCIVNQPERKQAITHACSLIPLPLQFVIVTEQEFVQLKSSHTPNAIRTAVEKNIILHGIESYYSLMKKSNS